MEQRIDPKIAPGVYEAMLGLERYLRHSSLEQRLIDLIKLRASQINGCAYCIDMHWKDLRVMGDTEQRLYGLDAWEESPYYSERERAALAWTEAVTKIREGHASEEVYESVKAQFSEKEVADLTFAIATINAWNRLAIAGRATPGSYQPSTTHSPEARSASGSSR
jgi:AhpD family alkylhydroperoxidase